MSQEDRLFEQRYQKIKEIEALGYSAYPRKFDYTHTPGRIHEEYEPWDGDRLENETVPVKVCGRLMTVRRQGKAGFCHIQQQGEKIQIYVRKDEVGDQAFELYKKLDAGDIIGAEGRLFRTRTGELTVRVERLEFLAKALLSLPEKWHGLQDVEIRYRQRYLDLLTNPEVREVFLKREKLIAALRRSLEKRGYVEGRDADDAADLRRRAGAAVSNASQHARRRLVPADRAGAVSEAAGCRRPRPRL